MSTDTNQVLQVLADAPVVPVITLNRLADAESLGAALLEGGLRLLEVTLRTDAALACIEAMAKRFPEALIASGTVLNEGDLKRSADAGAKLAISPGATPALLEAGVNSAITFMPGVATASEAMVAREAGFKVQKFFPAQAAGGVVALKGLAGPLGDLRFCPTGGVNLDNMGEFLKLPNVVAVGGSWMVPEKLIAEGNFSEITRLAREAVEKARGT